MKSVIKKNDQQKPIEYPCLMIGDFTGVIVLFVKEKHGMVVKKCGSYDYHYGTDWEMSTFKPFNGTIELSNS